MAKASYAECIAVIKKAAGESISDKQAEQLLNEIDDLVARKKSEGNLEGIDGLVLNDLDAATNAIREAGLIEKRNALINARILKDNMQFVRKFKNPGEGLTAMLVGTVRGVEGSRNSIDARGHFLKSKYAGLLIDDLEKEGLLELFARGELDRNVAREMWELPNGKPGITGDRQAQKMAEIIHRYQNDMIARQNRAGAYIKPMPGYIVRQSHDMVKIRNAGYEAWRDWVLPLLDPDKTFGGMKPDEFLRATYDGLVTGMHFKVKGEAAADKITYLLGFKGPSNLAKRISQERILHFKDANSWFDYNQKFGQAALRESIMFGFEHGARNIALMEGLGTNPLAMLDRMIAAARSESKQDLVKFDSIKDQRLHAMYRELDGTTRIPANLSMARIGRGVRFVNNMSKLGAAVVSSITDIPFQAAEMRRHGVSLLDAYGNAFMNLLRGRGSDEQKTIARHLGVGFEGIIGDVVSRFSAEDLIGGRMAKMQQRFFKLNLMNWWNDSHKTGVGMMMSNHLASFKEKAFNSIPKEESHLLSMYNIDAKDWDLLRATVFKEGDFEYLTPDGIRGLDEARIAKGIGLPEDMDASVKSRKVREYMDDLETKLGAYFTDRANFAIPTPGAAEHAMMNVGTQPGTALGEALRFVMQFKSFPISALHKGFGAELFGKGAASFREAMLGGKGDMTGLVHLIVATTVFGYGAMSAKDLLKGRTPRTPQDPKTWAAAFAQGGGLGIYGDFMFGEFSRYGRSAAATLAGPTFGQIDDVAELWTRFRRGDDVAANIVRLAINNTPFINLFYTRTALDYLLLYQLQESVNPGYLHRMESRIMRENEQRYFMPPSQVVPYGGGF